MSRLLREMKVAYCFLLKPSNVNCSKVVQCKHTNIYTLHAARSRLRMRMRLRCGRGLASGDAVVCAVAAILLDPVRLLHKYHVGPLQHLADETLSTAM